MDTRLRMFTAIVPPLEVREELEEFMQPRFAAASFRWSDPEQWHITLGFYPHVEQWALDELIEGLGQVVAKRDPFMLSLTGGGAFPNVGEAKVLWLGIGADEAATAELELLARGCRGAANHAGAKVNGGKFHPHVTLARMGEAVEVTNWVRLLDTVYTQPWLVEEVALIASYLGQGRRRRPRYEVVATFALAGSSTA